MAIRSTFPRAPWLFMLILVQIAVALSFVTGQDLPTVYEYFTPSGEITSGLNADGPVFTLNEKPLRIIGGTLHYYRIHPSRWRDAMKKLRASGANTLETYVPWNLHEPQQGVYDFGGGQNDFSSFLNVTRYIEMAKEEDLLVLFRPGPYICSEWEYGGFPSWLLRDPQMHVRGAYPPYLERIKLFYTELLKQVHHLQFTFGGPIIGIQIENEYGYFDKIEKSYLEFLVNIFKTLGFENTLLFTSDGAGRGDTGSLPGLLRTVNFNNDAMGNLGDLLESQPNRPLMAMEFWTGWFDSWLDDGHHTWPVDRFEMELSTVFEVFNASINFLPFQGGTNFGFMAGGMVTDDNVRHGVVTSYDFDAILTEAGDYTEKYEILSRLAELYAYPKLKRPSRPSLNPKMDYGEIRPETYIKYEAFLEQLPETSKFTTSKPTVMEFLDMNGGSGQSYGYIVHRINTSAAVNGSFYKAGVVTDFASLVVDGKVDPASFAGEGNARYWIYTEREISLTFDPNASKPHVIDLMIENMARSHSALDDQYATQRKGLPEGQKITLDGLEPTEFTVFALEFKSAWVKNLTGFEPVLNSTSLHAPIIVQSTFAVSGEPGDTYLELVGWHKGIAFINGFNIGRYFRPGPQRRLYVPAPLLHQGVNTLTVFEQLEVGQSFAFKSTPDVGA